MFASRPRQTTLLRARAPRSLAPRALALVASVALVALSLIGSAPRPASAADLPSSYGLIANRALAALTQKGGECFPWVRQVVYEATGRMIGVDYRLGYLQAGAVEIPIAEARNGDVIQLINDAKTDPNADYPGMHTAIVLESQGAGKFRVVDSNFRLDHIVRVHDDYDPKVHAASRPNITAHAYRFPVGGGPGVPAVSTAPLAPGNTAEVMADGDCLRLRVTASLGGFVLGCLATGTRVTVLPERTDADGLGWRRVTGNGLTGWAADRYLRATTAGIAAPEPPSTIGKIVGGTIPQTGAGLIVFGGGTNEQLAAAIGCRATGTVWATIGDQMVQFIPGATLAVVNETWARTFPVGIPANTALVARCL